MAEHFLQYWLPAQVDYEFSHGPILNHAAGEQLYRVQPDDTVWIVTVRPPGELKVVGKLQVGECTSLEEAKRRFGNDVYKASHHVIAKPGTEESLREVDLTDVAAKLRFQSSRSDRLRVVRGKVNAQQLQTMRKLTSASADLLEGKWSGS